MSTHSVVIRRPSQRGKPPSESREHRLVEDTHRDGAIEHDDDALGRISPRPARLYEQPCKKQDREELQPQRYGTAQPLQPTSFCAHRAQLFEEKERARDHPPRLPLQQVDEQDGRDAEERPETRRDWRSSAP
jgi:hypothetical protein